VGEGASYGKGPTKEENPPDGGLEQKKGLVRYSPEEVAFTWKGKLSRIRRGPPKTGERAILIGLVFKGERVRPRREANKGGLEDQLFLGWEGEKPQGDGKNARKEVSQNNKETGLRDIVCSCGVGSHTVATSKRLKIKNAWPPDPESSGTNRKFKKEKKSFRT